MRRVGDGRPTITCYLAVAMRHHRISAIPRIQIAVSQFSFFTRDSTRFMCFAYCRIAYTSPGSCKDGVLINGSPQHHLVQSLWVVIKGRGPAES